MTIIIAATFVLPIYLVTAQVTKESYVVECNAV